MPELGPREMNVSRPSAARAYDYYLDGEHNYEVDRAFATRVLDYMPYVRRFARDNRAFLQRAVRYCAAQGIVQFLDIGSGLPTAGNVHEIAQRDHPDARVVYVDNEREAITAATEILHGLDTVTAIDADLRQPELILNHPETLQLIDYTQPLACLMVSVLPFVSDSDGIDDIMAVYRNALPAGSHLVLSHATMDAAPPEVLEGQRRAVATYDETPTPIVARTYERFASFFGEFTLVEPGITYAADWRPDAGAQPDPIARPCNHAAVARKP